MFNLTRLKTDKHKNNYLKFLNPCHKRISKIFVCLNNTLVHFINGLWRFIIVGLQNTKISPQVSANISTSYQFTKLLHKKQYTLYRGSTTLLVYPTIFALVVHEM